MADITMPQLGETVTEGTITKWFKAVGDTVAEDEPLFEVSTDKVDSEVPSPTGGTLVEIKVAEGDTVDVGTVLAVIGEAGDAPAPADGEAPAAEEAGAAAKGENEEQPAEEKDEPAEDEAPTDQEGEGDEGAGDDAAAATASDEAPADAAGGGEPDAPADAPAADLDVEPTSDGSGGAAPKAPAGKGDAGGKLLSPVVRRLIAEHGIDPATIQGTGVGGRITRSDVLAAADAKGASAPAEAPSAPAAPAAAKQAPSPRPAPEPLTRTPGERDTVIPHSNIRKRSAEHLRRSLDTSAHVYASIEVDYEAVERVRRAHKDAWRAEEGFGLTYLPFISRAVVDAIHEFPETNATFTDDALVVHNYLNLGIAVDLDFKGLMVPVVRDADTKRMRAVAREISDLAARARSKKLTPDDISDGTFTITNPGPFGTLLTMPIINQPQVAILSTDGVKRRPVVIDLPDGTEGIAIHSVGNLALSWDHRAFDGAYAASFLHRIKELLETRDWAAEL